MVSSHPHCHRAQPPEFDRPHRKAPLHWYRRMEFILCKVGKKKDTHAFRAEMRHGLDQLAQEVWEDSLAQGKLASAIVGEGGLIERYKSGDTVGVVFEREFRKLAPMASEYDLTDLALELELADLAFCYQEINKRLLDPGNWQRVDQQVIDLYKNHDFTDLASKESQFLINQERIITSRKNAVDATSRAISQYERGVLSKHLDEAVWKLASRVREDKKLAHLIKESSFRWR